MKPRPTTTYPLAALLIAALARADGPCCSARSQPGCDDTPCQAMVCAVDPFCCSSAWDERCAGEASVLCLACRPAPGCVLPMADALAPEACGASTDDPCHSGTPHPLPLDVMMAGSVWSDDGNRDVDWFEVTLSQPGSLLVRCFSAGPIAAAIVDTACPPTVFAESPDGCPSRCEACLPAGTYRVAVRSLLFEAFPCGDSRMEYRLVASTSACLPEAPANDRCEFAQPVTEGPIAFDTRRAVAEPTWLPPLCDEGAGLAFTHDVWFSFTAAADGVYRIGTCGAGDFDARLAVYEGCGGALLDCSDDACDGAAQVEIPLSCGSTAMVRLGGWGHGATGALMIEAVATDPCACEGDLDGSGEVDPGDIALALLDFGMPGGPADLDRDLEVTMGDVALLLLMAGSCP
jgi:hypothetical protein